MIEEQRLASIYQIVNNSKLKIYQHGFVKTKDWYYHQRKDPYNRIYIITSGEGYLKNKRGKWSLKEGYAYFIPRDKIFTMGSDSEIEMFWIHFDLELFPGIDMGDRLRELKTVSMTLDKDDFLIQTLYSLKPGDMLNFKGRILGFCGTFLNLDQKNAEKDYILLQKYRNIFPYFSSNININHAVSDFSQKLGMSYPSFYRHFYKDFGCSPKEFQQKKVLQKACHLLIHSKKSTKEIAAELGFQEASYFSRFFKQKTGDSPLKYRKEFLYIPEIAGKSPFWETDLPE